MNRTVASYRCADKACVSRNRADLDELVTDIIIERLSRPDVATLLAPNDDRVRRAVIELADVRRRLDQAADDYADGKIDREQLQRITERLRPKLEAAEAQARTVDSSPLLADFATAKDVRATFLALPLTRQRAIVDALIDIRVMRTATGARTFDPKAIIVTKKKRATRG